MSIIQHQIRHISNDMDSRVCIGCGPHTTAGHQIIAQPKARDRYANERRVDLTMCMVHVSECIIRLVGKTGENNRDIDPASP